MFRLAVELGSPMKVIALSALLLLTTTPGRALAEAAGSPPPAESRAVVTPTLAAKLRKLVDAAGAESALPASIATALGFTAGGQPWPDRQAAVQSHGTGTVHAVAVGATPGGDFALSVRGPAAITVFRVRADGTMAGAVSYFQDTKQAMALFPGQAKTDFAAEVVFWSSTIDGLITPN